MVAIPYIFAERGDRYETQETSTHNLAYHASIARMYLALDFSKQHLQRSTISKSVPDAIISEFLDQLSPIRRQEPRMSP